jgi:diketogulonate reductase-like aldo/keto reductase
VSNFDVDDLEEAQAALPGARLAANQVLYHLGDRGIERKLIPYCERHGIAVVGYSPFGHAAFPSARSAGGRVLNDVAARHGRSPRAVVLAFLTRRPSLFTIPKATRPEHVRDNASALDLVLLADDVAAIDRAFPAPDRDVPLGVI